MISNKNVEGWTIHLLFIAGKKQWNFSAHLLCFSKPWVDWEQHHLMYLAKHAFSTQNVADNKMLCSYWGLTWTNDQACRFLFCRLAGLGQVIKQPTIRMYMLTGPTLFWITIAVFGSVQSVPPWLVNKIIAHKYCISLVACGLSGFFVFNPTHLLFYFGSCSSLLFSKLCSSCLFYAFFFFMAKDFWLVINNIEIVH